MTDTSDTSPLGVPSFPAVGSETPVQALRRLAAAGKIAALNERDPVARAEALDRAEKTLARLGHVPGTR